MNKVTDVVSLIRSDNLLQYIKRKFNSVYAFCEANSLDYSSVNKYVNQTLKMGDAVARKLEKALGEVEGTLDKGLQVKKVELLPFIKDAKEYSRVIDHNEKSENLIQINTDFIAANGWEPENLCVILLNDESMEPTIKENAQLIISLSQRDIISNKVYAIKYKERIIVRRVQENLKNNTILLIPDAEAFKVNNLFKQEEILLSDATILGRVVYIMGLIWKIQYFKFMNFSVMQPKIDHEIITIISCSLNPS